MPDDDENTEGLEHEEPLGPDNPGSMAFKLARAADAPLPDEDKEGEAARQVEAEEAAVEVAEDKGEEGITPEPPKPKYASVEEAERAANEAARKMHEASEAAARDREAREALERENAELKAAKEAAEIEAAKPAAIEANQAAYEEALKRIKEIPVTRDDDGNLVYPDDYDKQVAAAWASTAPDPEKIIEEVTRRTEQKEAERRAAAEAKAAEESAATSAAQIRADAEKLAASEGLDMTPGSADYRLFYSLVDELAANPEHEYREKPFEEQVKWATGGVRQILGKKIELTDAERAAARRTQTRNAVLERGITRQVPAEQPRQRSMQEILGQ